MKNLLIQLLLFVILSCCLPVRTEAEDLSVIENSYLSQYMSLYGYTLGSESLKDSERGFSAQTIDCGLIQVRLEELLYDGQMMYTSASACPKDPIEVLVLPGGAEPGDPVSGHYFNDGTKDKSSYRTVAADANKKVIAVYAYIKEFDQIGLYFLDNFMDAEKTVLLSGASIAGGKEAVSVTWSIQLYEVNRDTWEYNFLDEMSIPVVMEPPQLYEEKSYHTLQGESAPFSSVSLVHTPLGMYAIPQWNDEDDSGRYSVHLEQADQQEAVPSGLSLIDTTYSLDKLPHSIVLSTTNLDADKKQEYTLIADSQENIR